MLICGGATGLITGGDFNFIGGGSGICVDYSDYASSLGGLNNDIITGNYSAIAGGKNNLISGVTTSHNYNFLGGGWATRLREHT